MVQLLSITVSFFSSILSVLLSYLFQFCKLFFLYLVKYLLYHSLHNCKSSKHIKFELVVPIIIFKFDFSTNQNILHMKSFCDQTTLTFSSVLFYTFHLDNISNFQWFFLPLAQMWYSQNAERYSNIVPFYSISFQALMCLNIFESIICSNSGSQSKRSAGNMTFVPNFSRLDVSGGYCMSSSQWAIV